MLTLWLLVVLGAASLQVLTEVRARIDAAALARARPTATYAAESGFVAARALLDGMIRSVDSFEDQVLVFPEFQRTIASWGERPVGSGRYQVVAEDLNARIDLNRSRAVVVEGLLRQFVSAERAVELVESLRGAEALEAEGEPAFAESPGGESGDGTLPTAARPLMYLEDLALVPGFGEALPATLAPYVTVWSDGFVNVNSADERALAAIPEIGPSAAEALVSARERGGPLPSTVAVYAEMSAGGAAGVSSRLPGVTTTPRRVLLVSRGWEEGHPYTHEVRVVVDVLFSRLVTGSRVRVRSWSEAGR